MGLVAPLGILIGVVAGRADQWLVGGAAGAARAAAPPHRRVVGVGPRGRAGRPLGAAVRLDAAARGPRQRSGRAAPTILLQALLSLLAWAGVALGAVLVAASRRWRAGPGLRVHPAPYRPSRAPSSVAVAGAAALVGVLPATVWMLWLDQAWARGIGAVALLCWSALSGGGAVLAAWIVGGVCVGASKLNPTLGLGVRWRQLEVAGAVLAGAWSGVFLNALWAPLRGGAHSEDAAYTLLFTALVVVVSSTALWSGGHLLRTAAADRRAAPESAGRIGRLASS
ncbi:MAG: hypothetical protein R3F59_15505 [Myxococcota bacterium]